MGKDKVKSAIQEILGKEGSNNSENEIIKPSYSIKNILIVSTRYDYFILEEEGRLKDLFIQSYQSLEKDYIPVLTHSTEEQVIELISSVDYDMVFFFNPPSDRDICNLARKIKKIHDMPIVLVNRNTPEIVKLLQDNLDGAIDWIFTWSGDGKIFIHIIQFIEDMAMSQEGSADDSIDKIIIVENKPQYYSKLMYESQKLVSEYMEQVLHDGLTWTQKLERIGRRPRTLIALDMEKAEELYSRHSSNTICMALCDYSEDSKSNKALEKMLKHIRKDSPSLPILILASNGDEIPREETVLKNSPLFLTKYDDFLRKSMGSTILILSDENGNEIYRVENIKELEKAVRKIPKDLLASYWNDGLITRWLKVSMENKLGQSLAGLPETEIEELRKSILSEIHKHRKSTHLGRVNKYSRQAHGSYSRFSRIGKGAMGGKARGLAFMDKLVSTYIEDNTLPKMKIRIPRTIVLCSDIFDSFIEDNNLLTEDLFELTDERIAQKFMEADLSPVVLGDLRSFIRGTTVPLVIRSSSLLEDALHHPFAGVYASLLLPNESWETDIRFQELCTSIKYVFASVFFQGARTYMATIQNNMEDEKMAVVIQELVGKKHGSMFYPTLSGVAKSYDYYPSGRCKSSDGVVSMAMGLGKEIVDGGSAFRFCPLHPKAPKYGSQKDLIDHSQKEFYAVDLNSYVNIMQRDEDSTIKRYSISVAEQHGELTQTASTFDPGNQRLNPGIGRDGMRVIDFAPILQLETIELSKAIRLLLKASEIAIGTPVEIEFAMIIPSDPKKKPELCPLQVRSMQSGNSMEDITIGEYPEDEILCYSDSVLGNGITKSIKDIVYVKRENYALANNPKIIKHIQEINKKLIKKKSPYILVGPGRRGSTDPWLGIPVTWSDIAGSKLIIETPVEERPIDPSQGSHFFHNMIAANTAYFTILTRGKSSLDWEWMDSMPSVEETEYIRHIRLDEPLEVRIDGKSSEGVILKNNKSEAR